MPYDAASNGNVPDCHAGHRFCVCQVDTALPLLPGETCRCALRVISHRKGLAKIRLTFEYCSLAAARYSDADVENKARLAVDGIVSGGEERAGTDESHTDESCTAAAAAGSGSGEYCRRVVHDIPLNVTASIQAYGGRLGRGRGA